MSNRKFKLLEKEWNDPSTPKYFDQEKMIKLMRDLEGEEEFDDLRHEIQPTVYGLFFKTRGGDYRGRTNMRNTSAEVHWGIDDLKNLVKKLKQRKKDVQSDRGYNRKYGHIIARNENFGFADFPKKEKSYPKQLKEIPVDEVNIGGLAKNSMGANPYGSTASPRPYDQPMKNRFSRGNQPPNKYPSRTVDVMDDDEEENFMEVDMQTGAMKDQKKKNKIDHVPNQNPRELMQSVHDELVSEMEMDAMIEEMLLPLRLERSDEYKEFFNKMMAKWNISSPTELSDEEKKKFFNSVDQRWQTQKEKKGKYREDD